MTQSHNVPKALEVWETNSDWECICGKQAKTWVNALSLGTERNVSKTYLTTFLK